MSFEVMLGAVAIVALLAARRVWWGYPVPAAPARALARRELALLTAAADGVFPPGGAIEASGLMEHATLIFPAPGRGGFRRFSSLKADQREAVLRGWAESSLPPRRLVFHSLRAVLGMSYLSDPAVLRELGLAPRDVEPGYCEADLLFPPIGHGPDAIRIEPEDLRDVEAPATLACDAALDPRYAAPRA
jgi:hypothetical protein